MAATLPFLGHAARTPVGPARLALRTGAAVVVGLPSSTLELTITPIMTDDLAASPETFVGSMAR